MSDDRGEFGMQMVAECIRRSVGMFERKDMQVSGSLVVVISGPGCYGAVAYDPERYASDAEFLDRIEAWIAERRVDLARAAGVKRNLN